MQATSTTVVMGINLATGIPRQLAYIDGKGIGWLFIYIIMAITGITIPSSDNKMYIPQIIQ